VLKHVEDTVAPPVITLDEWLGQVQEQYDELLNDMARYAIARFGSRNNNWLRIIPALVDRLAKDISHACFMRTNDNLHGAKGQEYQATLWEQLYADQIEQTEQPTTSESGMMSFSGVDRDAMLKRVRQMQMPEEREYLDPWTADQNNKARPTENQPD
jgi:hypothetical protein